MTTPTALDLTTIVNSRTYDDPDVYEVFILDEVHILTNILRMLSAYRRKHRGMWPRKLCVSEKCEFPLSLGADIEIATMRLAMIDALYFSLYKPYRDVDAVELQPTEIPKQRNPIEDDGRVYRRRK